MIRKLKNTGFLFLITLLLLFSGCAVTIETSQNDNSSSVYDRSRDDSSKSIESFLKSDIISSYSGEPYRILNDNLPEFTTAQKKSKKAFEKYSKLDRLGRCGTAFANICEEIMPKEKRGAIGAVKPTGWQTIRYAGIEGKYLYNRCHLIGYQLAGENSNKRNLITGTRYLNISGMLGFENEVADYVEATRNHVLYRVTPVFEGDNLLASGVHMEAYSVEDKGKGVCFNIFAYNVQPGIEIDYATGKSRKAAGTNQKNKDAARGNSNQQKNSKNSKNYQYVINKHTKKFHYPDCSSVKETLPKYRKYSNDSREKLMKQGYEPCGRCHS